MKLVILFTVAALACAQVYAAPQIVEDTAFYRPTYGQNGGVDPGYYQPGNGQGAIDPGFYQPGNGQVVDPGFYRPGNPNQYEPISNGPEFVEDGRKHYDNPNLRSGHY
ncbi:unnamed protein product [Leptosia nina]|uniref:Uncharacterized protein n=1 Tax=Leptosia nina TaxID=320188 RepID=A0AAV1JN74_9NEOP